MHARGKGTSAHSRPRVMDRTIAPLQIWRAPVTLMRVHTVPCTLYYEGFLQLALGKISVLMCTWHRYSTVLCPWSQTSTCAISCCLTLVERFELRLKCVKPATLHKEGLCGSWMQNV